MSNFSCGHSCECRHSRIECEKRVASVQVQLDRAVSLIDEQRRVIERLARKDPDQLSFVLIMNGRIS